MYVFIYLFIYSTSGALVFCKTHEWGLW